MYIKIIDQNPSYALKSSFNRFGKKFQSNLINVFVLFLISLTLFLYFFYTYYPPTHDSHNIALIISIIYIASSGFALLLINGNRISFWKEYHSTDRVIKNQGIVYNYTITSNGIILELPECKIETNWTAYENYNEREEFIVIVAKKEALVRDIWLNKSFIKEADLVELRKNLVVIFAFV